MWQAAKNKINKLGRTWILCTAALLSAAWVQARTPLPGENRAVIALSELPAQGRSVYALIHQGGPFPYDKDGATFGNRERLLPLKQRGYYREYTVKTPGVRHRGARRIVCGGQPRTPEVCYYTADHYSSFRMIME